MTSVDWGSGRRPLCSHNRRRPRWWSWLDYSVDLASDSAS